MTRKTWTFPVNQRIVRSERDFLPLIQAPELRSAALKFPPLSREIQELKCLNPKSMLARNLILPQIQYHSRTIQRVPSQTTRYEPALIKSTSLATEPTTILTRIVARQRPNSWKWWAANSRRESAVNSLRRQE